MCMTQEDGIACCFEVGHPLPRQPFPSSPHPNTMQVGRIGLHHIFICSALVPLPPCNYTAQGGGKGLGPPL